MLFKIFSLFFLMVFSNCNHAKNEPMVLQYVVKHANPIIKNPKLLILLHGFGSNEQDLFSFANHLPDKYLIISARAPLTMSEGQYMWFDIDFSTGTRVVNTKDAEQSRIILSKFIDQLKEKYEFDHNQIYLAGFSQGAMMSYGLALLEPEKVTSILALSGRILPTVSEKINAPSAYKNLSILIIHGAHDQVIPIHHAHESRATLTKHGIAHEYHELKMGHEINQEAFNIILNWLRK